MKVLIAPNAFKHALSAFEAASLIKKGFRKSSFKGELVEFPIADGGNGTLDLVIDKLGGRIVQVEASDPLGRQIKARLGLLNGNTTAVIEMAEASGIHLIKDKERAPLRASSFGTGELVKKARDLGASKIIIGLGGSASIDGGAGMLQALGVKMLDSEGNEVEPGGGNLHKISSIDRSYSEKLFIGCEIIVACDVESPLLGANGAAAVYGPQKGATSEEVKILERNLSYFCKLVHDHFSNQIAHVKFGGAAGGTAAGLHGILNATLVHGVDYLLKLTNFEKVLQNCDLIITAEGKLDLQTIEGKGPAGLATMARSYKKPIVCIAGQISDKLIQNDLKIFNAVFSLSTGPGTLEEAIANSRSRLLFLSEQLGNLAAAFRR